MFELVKGEIVTTGANLRKGPGTRFDIVDQIAKGDIVQLFSSWVDPTWVKVKVLKTRTGIAVGREGYIWSSELRLLPPEIEPVVPVPMPAPTPEPIPVPPVAPDSRHHETEAGEQLNAIMKPVVIGLMLLAVIAVFFWWLMH